MIFLLCFFWFHVAGPARDIRRAEDVRQDVRADAYAVAGGGITDYELSKEDR